MQVYHQGCIQVIVVCAYVGAKVFVKTTVPAIGPEFWVLVEFF